MFLKWILVLSLIYLRNYSASEEIEAISGDEVTLQCQVSSDADIMLLRWDKPDLKSDEYVYLVRVNHINEKYHHPSFRGRVKLRDPQMKDGDVSVILKNVNIKDTGRYECFVGIREESPEIFATIDLKVTVSVSPLVPKNLTADTGENVSLPCETLKNTTVTAVEWRRTDKKDYVFLYRDGRSVPDNQHPYYKNSVKLKDSEMKDGDMSLILKDVMNIDSGTYECWINQRGINHRTSIIDLYVYPPVSPSVPINITANTGDRVTLPCRALSNTPITAVKWTMVNKKDHVFLYRDGRSVPDKQHPYYRNLSELSDSEMKDGNVSLILKDVMSIYSGRYECWVNQRGINLRMSIIDLYVKPGGDKDGGDNGHVGPTVIVTVIVLLVVAVGGCVVIYRKCKAPTKQNLNKPSAKKADDQQQMLNDSNVSNCESECTDVVFSVKLPDQTQ